MADQETHPKDAEAPAAAAEHTPAAEAHEDQAHAERSAEKAPEHAEGEAVAEGDKPHPVAQQPTDQSMPVSRGLEIGCLEKVVQLGATQFLLVSQTVDMISQLAWTQVSQLILIHDQATNGISLPDLQVPVSVVKNAVLHLVKVGQDTIQNSDDRILKEDMTPCLKKVEDAAEALHESSQLLKKDSTSHLAQKKLIEGSRGILNGVSQLLLTLDQSEVRKIVLQCTAVSEYLATTEIVHSMENLAEFVRDLTPILSRMSKSVESRMSELTIQPHRDRLRRGVEKVRALIPLLVSAMKAHVTICQKKRGAAPSELLPATESNRDYAVLQIVFVVHEISRVLQLTHVEFTPEDSFSSAVVDPSMALQELRTLADDTKAWIYSPDASIGTHGEVSFRNLMQLAHLVAQMPATEQTTGTHKHNEASTAVLQQLRALEPLWTRMCHYRLRHEGRSEDAVAVGEESARHVDDLVSECTTLLQQLPSSSYRDGLHRRVSQKVLPSFSSSAPPTSLSSYLEQAERWLAQPWVDNLRPQGPDACFLLSQMARLEADELRDKLLSLQHAQPQSPFAGVERNARIQILEEEAAKFEKLSELVESSTKALEDLVQQGVAQSSPLAQQLSYNILHNVHAIRNRLHFNLVQEVTDKMNDNLAPLRALLEAAKPEKFIGREKNLTEEEQAAAMQLLEQRKSEFKSTTNGLIHLAEKLATYQLGDEVDVQRRLLETVKELSPLTEQVCLAATTSLQWRLLGNSGAECITVDENLEKMQERWTGVAELLRVSVDESIDRRAVLQVQEMRIQSATEATETSIASSDAPGVVFNTANIARRANRVAQIARLEADNSADSRFVDRMNDVVHELKAKITPMVVSAKDLVGNLRDASHAQRWRADNSQLVQAVGSVRLLLAEEGRKGAPCGSQVVFPTPACDPASVEKGARSVPPHHSHPLHLHQGGVLDGPQSPMVPPNSLIPRWNEYDQPPLPVQETSTSFLQDQVQMHNGVLLLDESYNNRSEHPYWSGGTLPMGVSPQNVWLPWGPQLQLTYQHPGQPSPSSSYHPNEAASSYAPAGFFHTRPESLELVSTPDPDHGDEEFRFPVVAPQEDEPIISAAHALHCEANQWSSRGNDLVAAAKRMAFLMGQLGVIVERGGDSKRELIQVSMAIADASREVSRLGLLLATQCTDRRIQKNLEEFCSQVSTVGTQLKILSTVKASMLGTQEHDVFSHLLTPILEETGDEDSESDEDDKQNTEMLVLNASNLMKAVTAVVKAAESASIKTYVAGESAATNKLMSLRWVRRRPQWLVNSAPHQEPGLTNPTPQLHRT